MMSPRKRRKKLWSYTSGERPYTVLAFEREKDGVKYLQAWDPTSQRPRRRSLGHRDRDLAIAQADAEARKLREGAETLAARGPATVGGVLALYLVHRTPQKTSAGSRAEDLRRAELWRRFLGAGKRVAQLGRAEWDAFIALRTTGAIDHRGRPVPDEIDPETKRPRRRAVEPRTVDGDLVFLVAVFNWACQWNTADGRPLLERNPWGAPAAGVKRALERPKTPAPRRPVGDYETYLALQKVAPRVLMQVKKGTPGAELVARGRRVNGRTRKAGPVLMWMARSYFGELLDLVEDNGRRITSVCRLRYEDIEREDGHIARVAWPPLKGETRTFVPVSARTQALLEQIVRARPGVGSAPVFPRPRDPSRPISRHLADDWYREAETLAALPHAKGACWHQWRRKWGTERKHLPTKDVMAVGGWRDERSLKTAYQHADEETMLAVVNEPKKLVKRRAVGDGGAGEKGAAGPRKDWG